LSKAESQTEELRAEKAKLEDKAAIESELKGSLITAQSEIASLRVEKNKLEGDKAVLSDLQAQITRLEAERMEATTEHEDVEKQKRDLQSQMDTTVASLSDEIESLKRSRDTEGDQRLRAEEQCQTMQKNLDLENQGKREAIERLTKSQRETKRMAAKIGTLEAELKILRAQVTAPTAPPTVEQGTPLAPEVQSANEAPVDDTFTSVLNEPLNAQNSLPNIFEQIPNLGEQRRMPTSAKRQSILPPLQRPFPTSAPHTRVPKHVDRIGKSGVVAAPRMNKIQVFSNLTSPLHDRLKPD
jgi:DNA repair exonuclease SbcCD ATPase subunit